MIGERRGVDAPEREQRRAQRVHERGLDDLAVRDRGQSAVPLGLVVQPARDARAEHGEALAAVRARVRVEHPGAHGVGLGLVDVGQGPSGPVAEVALGDRLVRARLEAGRLGRLDGSAARGW